MFKPTAVLQSGLRRLKLTTKRGPAKGYYKGNRTGSMGFWHPKIGRGGLFVIDLDKVRTYVVPPNLEKFQMTPFVDGRIEKPVYDSRTKTMSLGQIFLDEWKMKKGTE